MRVLMLGVELVEQIELLALSGRGDVVVADVLDQFLQIGILRIDESALINTGKKARLPILGVLDRIAAGTHGDEAGEILVFGSKAIGNPRAQAGAAHLGV